MNLISLQSSQTHTVQLVIVYCRAGRDTTGQKYKQFNICMHFAPVCTQRNRLPVHNMKGFSVVCFSSLHKHAMSTPYATETTVQRVQSIYRSTGQDSRGTSSTLESRRVNSPTLALNVLTGRTYLECMASCVACNNNLLNVEWRINERNVPKVDMLIPLLISSTKTDRALLLLASALFTNRNTHEQRVPLLKTRS